MKNLQPRSCLLLFLALTGAAPPLWADEQVSDTQGTMMITVSPPWRAVPSQDVQKALFNLPNNNLLSPGVDTGRPGIVAFKATGVKDLLPTIQIARIDIPGLQVNADAREQLQRTIEKRYSEAMGTKFRLFSIGEERVNGVKALRVSGVYTWRTNNMRMLQLLIPGTFHVYAATYIAQEREFQRHLPEAQKILASVIISDAPVDVSWVGDFLKWLLFLVAVVAVIWGVVFTSSIKPGRDAGGGMFLPKIGGTRKPERKKPDNPFERRK